MTLLAIFGCAPATRENEISSVEGMSIEATVEQTTERLGTGGEGFVSDHVRVALLDCEGRALEREDLCVEMNDAALGTRTAHGHFYDRHPFYRLDDAAAHLDPDRECRFAIVRPDGTHHLAGIVRTPRALRAAQFEFPQTISHRHPVSIAWSNLLEPAEMVIYRSLEFVDPAGNGIVEGGSPTDLSALRLYDRAGRVSARQRSPGNTSLLPEGTR